MALSRILANIGAGGLFVAFALAFIIALLVTRLLIRRLGRRGILAHVNARSLHAHPTPIGGGWAVVPLIAAALALFPPPALETPTRAAAAGIVLLALLSWADDRRHLSAAVRLAAQALLVAAVLALSPPQMTVFSAHWPLWADRLLTALCWLWFINLFNFMDGIDGLAGVETLFITSGLLLVGAWLGHGAQTLLPLAVLAGATAGFLWHNWPPAKIFLGDVGSIPLGFVLGWLLIRLAAEGHLAAALLLPGYFLADATITLLRRLLAGEAIWQPHRSHFYQRAALALGGHAPVLWRVMALNAALLALALASLRWPLAAVVAGVVVIGAILLLLHRAACAPGH